MIMPIFRNLLNFDVYLHVKTELHQNASRCKLGEDGAHVSANAYKPLKGVSRPAKRKRNTEMES